MLELDREAHRYRWNGAAVPGVTEVIAAALGNPFADVRPAVLERKRQIGEAAHLACDMDDRGVLDDSTVARPVQPYLEAWRAFRRELRFELLISERPLYHLVHGYAGTPDRVIQIGDERAVVDIKTGLPGPQAALQTAAYADLIASHLGRERPLRRFALRALPSGRYKFDEHTHPGDWRDFLACLAVYRLKERIAA